MSLRLLAVPAAALLAGVGGGFGLHFALRPGGSALPLPELHGQAVWPPHARPAPEFALRDRSGAVVTLGAQRGRTVLLAFLLGIVRATASLAASQRPEVIVVSPGPRAARQPVPGALTLRGGAAALARLRRAYAARAWGGAVYLIDRRGDERAAYSVPFLPGFVSHDLAVLAEEK